MRVALGLEYDGSHYHGWQRQPGLRTVQGCLESAISHVANSDISVQCAGRTDTGVHATSQVVHFDVNVNRAPRAWIYGVNSKLPKDVCVRWAKVVEDDFHARFSAKSRRYNYVIYNNPIRPALFRSNITWHYRPLDNQAMAEGAQHLLGENDFSAFRSSECQSSTPMRCIEHLEVTRLGDWVVIDVQANAFLHHMVRNIAGVLMMVGNGKHDPKWVAEVLASRDRNQGGQTAPAYGLYLVAVKYPEQYDVDQRVVKPLFLPREL